MNYVVRKILCKLKSLDPKRIFFSVLKSTGFILLSLLPIGIYILNYSKSHGGEAPSSYQEYAVRIMTICFPILATKLCYDNDKAWFRYLIFFLILACLIYIFEFEQQTEKLPDTLNHIFFYLTFIIYLGTFLVSSITYYQSPVSEKAIQKIGVFRDKTANDIENNVKW